MPASKVVLLPILLASTVFCQTPEQKYQFEVASVKPSATLTAGGFNIGVHIDGAMVRCTYFSLMNYITMAYDVKDYQVIGPDWLTSEHFDIDAKRPEGVEGEKPLRAMVASLLEERFKMVTHRETRELPAYALVVAKGGLKIKEIPPDTDAVDNGTVDVNVKVGGRGGTTVELPGGASLSYGLNKLEARKVDFPSIMDSLSKFLDRPVVDETGLKGRYNFTLDYSIDELRNLVRASGADASHIPDLPGEQVSIFTSVQALGLKFEQRKVPVPVIVIDSIQKTPTAN